MRRRLRWDDRPGAAPPKHPYRDTALVYAGFAVVIVLVATLTGGGVVRALVFAGLFWAAATGYGIVSWRRRLRERERREIP